jgi:hypothetical protein
VGDEAMCKALLESAPNLGQTLSENDRRKLANAAENNNPVAVRLMLAAGWPVDARGQFGATALHWAAWHGNAGMVREILRYQPPLEVRDQEFDGPPLRWAIHGSKNGWHCKTGDYASVVEALLEVGAKAPPWSDDIDATEPVRAVLRRNAERS